LNDSAVLGGAEMRGIAVAKRSRREQVVGVREVPFHGVRYQSHDGGRWQRATMKARVVSESIHPAIFDSKLLVEFHIILDESGDDLRESMTVARMAIHWNTMNALKLRLLPSPRLSLGCSFAPSATRRPCRYQPCSHFKSDESAPRRADGTPL